MSSDRNSLIETTDEALGSETEIFPNFPTAPISTPRTKTCPRGLRLSRHSGHRHFTKRVTERGWTKTDLPSLLNPVANRLLIWVLHQFTGPKWAQQLAMTTD